MALVALVVIFETYTQMNGFNRFTSQLALIVGSVTLSGSLIAAGKLDRRITQKPVILNGHNIITYAALIMMACFLTVSYTHLVRGQQAPLVGRICMDQCMLDVSDVEDVMLEDEVVLFGKQGKTTLSVDAVAKLIGTINYEVLCMISNRVPRLYVE